MLGSSAINGARRSLLTSPSSTGEKRMRMRCWKGSRSQGIHWSKRVRARVEKTMVNLQVSEISNLPSRCSTKCPQELFNTNKIRKIPVVRFVSEEMVSEL